jgi:hypothetical protein
MHSASPFFCMAAKFGPSDKRIKKIDSVELKFFRRRAVSILFDHKRNEEILKELKVEPTNEI